MGDPNRIWNCMQVRKMVMDVTLMAMAMKYSKL
jgi:hypothetical protein